MAQLSQRRYNSIPTGSGIVDTTVVPIAPIVPSVNYQSGTYGSLTGTKPSTASAGNIGGSAAFFGDLSGSTPGFFQQADTNVSLLNRTFTNTSNTPRTVTDAFGTAAAIFDDSYDFYNILYKPDSTGASTVVQTATGNPWGYVDYLLEKTDQNLKLWASADNFQYAVAGLQNVADFYYGKGIEVPQSAAKYTGARLNAEDGKYYVQSSSNGLGLLNANTSYSLGKANSSLQPVLMSNNFVTNTDKGITIGSIPKVTSYSSPVYGINNTGQTTVNGQISNNGIVGNYGNWWEKSTPMVDTSYKVKTYSIPAASGFSYTSKTYHI